MCSATDWQLATDSWHTRMASVMRQFEKLTEDPVTDDNGESIMVIGLCRTVSGIHGLSILTRETSRMGAPGITQYVMQRKFAT